ncbi:hypothetical protein EUGRSUZ_B00525 [Eucalyptus grandis]|uniref:Uncharacterized protein n=2 Tax=Eucalyptus grandis TaxID=71139 RepID=A0ACC3LN25_EUCGR|nr:hypothetical protein EUGRSUZ_B00525 [Eucalyptus grandis]
MSLSVLSSFAQVSTFLASQRSISKTGMRNLRTKKEFFTGTPQIRFLFQREGTPLKVYLEPSPAQTQLRILDARKPIHSHKNSQNQTPNEAKNPNFRKSNAQLD